MGRSQVKFRATHGRGRGSGGARGRGHQRSSARGERALGSNAFRYDEREEEEEEAEEEGESAKLGQRQFFAEEKRYRATPGSYFQSRAVREWEVEDEEQTQALGALDFNWLAEQLAKVPPAIRYRMDPKDCVDLLFEPDEDQPVQTDKVIPPHEETQTAEEISRPSVTPAKSDEDALDSLLELSSSAAAATNVSVGSGAYGATTTSSSAAPPPGAATLAQMEEWLDDLLEM